MRFGGFHGVEAGMMPFSHDHDRDFRLRSIGGVDGLDGCINLGSFFLEDALELAFGDAVAVDEDMCGQVGGIVGLPRAQALDQHGCQRGHHFLAGFLAAERGGVVRVAGVDAGDHAGDAGAVFLASWGRVRDVDADEHGAAGWGEDVGFTRGQGLLGGGDLLVDAAEADVPFEGHVGEVLQEAVVVGFVEVFVELLD